MRVEAKNLRKVFETGSDRIVALNDVSFEIESGEFVSFIGPSGCGKSTLLEIAGGLTTPSGGLVELDGTPVDGPRLDVGVVFQQDSTMHWRTVIGNVTFGLEMRGVGRAERTERAMKIIDLVGLQGFEGNYPAQLSGGMRQRVALARTLVMNPRLILMDEPFGALDEQMRLILGDELLAIWSNTGATVLFVTHSIDEAILLSDRVVAMTARPGEVRATVEVELTRPRDSGVIGTPGFAAIQKELWSIIREESLKQLRGPTV